MHHFGIIKMGGRGGPDVSFILPKIAVPLFRLARYTPRDQTCYE